MTVDGHSVFQIACPVCSLVEKIQFVYVIKSLDVMLTSTNIFCTCLLAVRCCSHLLLFRGGKLNPGLWVTGRCLIQYTMRDIQCRCLKTDIYSQFLLIEIESYLEIENYL